MGLLFAVIFNQAKDRS